MEFPALSISIRGHSGEKTHTGSMNADTPDTSKNRTDARKRAAIHWPSDCVPGKNRMFVSFQHLDLLLNIHPKSEGGPNPSFSVLPVQGSGAAYGFKTSQRSLTEGIFREISAVNGVNSAGLMPNNLSSTGESLPGGTRFCSPLLKKRTSRKPKSRQEHPREIPLSLNLSLRDGRRGASVSIRRTND
jgi:hypothetical protein